MRIGENIRRLRLSHGLSQADLAQVAGVSDKAVSTWELGRKIPRMGALQRMADYFHLTLSDLIEGQADAPRPSPVLASRETERLSGGDIEMLADAYIAASDLTRRTVCNQLGLPYLMPRSEADHRWLSMMADDAAGAPGAPSNREYADVSPRDLAKGTLGRCSKPRLRDAEGHHAILSLKNPK